MLFISLKLCWSGVYKGVRLFTVMNHWPVPASSAQHWVFLRSEGNTRQFVNQFAPRTAQLHPMTDVSSASWWLRKPQVEFDDIRSTLASAWVLAAVDHEGNYILCTDAPDGAIGDVLAQKYPWRTLGTGALACWTSSGLLLSRITWYWDALCCLWLWVVGNPLQLNPQGALP